MKRNLKKLSVHTTIIRALRVLTDDNARRVGGASNAYTKCLGAACGDVTIFTCRP
jgi:hypothetical protein